MDNVTKTAAPAMLRDPMPWILGACFIGIIIVVVITTFVVYACRNPQTNTLELPTGGVSASEPNDDTIRMAIPVSEDGDATS